MAIIQRIPRRAQLRALALASISAVGSLGSDPALAQHASLPATAVEVQAEFAGSDLKDGYLSELLARAVSSHPSISAARFSVRAAGADIEAARWQAFPSLSVEGMWLGDEPNSRQASLVVDQPIWTGGRLSSAVRRAKAQHQIAIAAYREAVVDIMIDVSQTYREYHRLNRKSAILQASLTRHRELVRSMERRVAQEVSPLADLELARSRAAQVEQEVATVAAQMQSSLQKLRELVGDPNLAPEPPSTEMPLGTFNPDLVISRTLSFNPTRQKLISEAAVADAEADSAKASILPQLSGQYSYNETYGHRVGLVLKAQSNGGLSSFSAAAAAREREQAADLKIAVIERDLRERVNSDIAEYNAARARISSTRRARDAAENVTESYVRQFVSGRRTWLDVMNAVREETSAKNDAIDAEVSAYQTRDRILMGSGGWPFPAELDGAQ